MYPAAAGYLLYLQRSKADKYPCLNENLNQQANLDKPHQWPLKSENFD